MFRMKELWGYMSHIFSDNKRYSKKIKKSQKLSDYKQAVSSLFREQEIIKGDIINSYDEKKHDKDKVSKVFGGNFIFIGMSEIIISLISIFINEIYYTHIILGLVFIIILGFIITYYQFFTMCKKRDNEMEEKIWMV